MEDEKMNEDKKKALEIAMMQIEKQFGKGSVMKLGSDTKLDVTAISTGSLEIDNAIGIGGVPRGRIVELYGYESSGKTTVALHIIKEAQSLGGKGAIIDVEHALDPAYCKGIGINTEELLVSQPDTGEMALEITEHLVRTGAVDVIVVDSVSALTPKAEIEGQMGDSHIGLQARLMSQALRKLAGAVYKSNCVVIFINQVREKIGMSFGSPNTTSGGRALKFYASVRLEITRVEAVKNGDEITGNRIRVKVVKNKVAPPHRTCETKIMFGKGIDLHSELINMGVSKGIIDKVGSWYSYNDLRLGQGIDNAKNYLISNPSIMNEIKDIVTDKKPIRNIS